jgi:hypothetical protein
MYTYKSSLNKRSVAFLLQTTLGLLTFGGNGANKKKMISISGEKSSLWQPAATASRPQINSQLLAVAAFKMMLKFMSRKIDLTLMLVQRIDVEVQSVEKY